MSIQTELNIFKQPTVKLKILKASSKCREFFLNYERNEQKTFSLPKIYLQPQPTLASGKYIGTYKHT
jgi:hypothetical protein